MLILIFGTIRLGYIPNYGNVNDPYSLNLEPLTSLHSFISLPAFLSFFLWIAFGIVLFLFFKDSFSLNKLTTVLFLIGVSSFFILKYLFPGQFLWVMD